jgi:hypothetical protein
MIKAAVSPVFRMPERMMPSFFRYRTPSSMLLTKKGLLRFIPKELKLFSPIRCRMTLPWRSVNSDRSEFTPLFKRKSTGQTSVRNDTGTMRRHYAGKEFGRSEH